MSDLAADLSPKMTQAVQRFIFREARLIDDKQFDEWQDLYCDDAIYWMPLAREQLEEDIHGSLFFEDKLLLKVRVERLNHPRAFSQQPPSFCQHVLQQPEILNSMAGGLIETRTPFIYVESRLDDQFTLAGVVHHQLRVVSGDLKIYRKRIELLNREAALPSIQLFL